MSLINRQNQNVSMPAIIETPSSIWMQGQEHDASTLTPLFGKQFHPFVSNTNTNGMIYTKYSGTLGSCYNNGSHTNRSYDYFAFNLEDFNRGMKDVNGYQWNDGFNYYTMEYGGYRMFKYNPSNQNLTYALVSRPDATTDYNPSDCSNYYYFNVHENFILDEDSTNVYFMGSSHRISNTRTPYYCSDDATNQQYRRITKQFAGFSKSTITSFNNTTSPLANSANCFHSYIGRSSTRIFVFRSKDDQNSTDLLMYNKSTNTVTTVQTMTHSGSHTPIPSEAIQLDSSGSYVFYHTQVVPNGVPSGSNSPKHQIQRIIFNKDGSFASGSATAVAYNTNCTVDYTLSGSSTPNDLWPNSWTTSTQRYFSRRSKSFLYQPVSGSTMYLIAFNITPYGSEDSNKNYYNALVFDTHPTASANLTYRSYKPIYTDLGGEIRGVIAMDSNTNRFLVVTTNNMAVYTFDTSSKTLTLAQTIPGEYRHYGVDTYGRLWATTYANDLFSFALDSPVRINITSPTASYSYTGTSISSSVNVEARNYLGSLVAVPTRLTIEGTSATFTSNGLSYIDVTTTTSSIVNIPITITNGGFTRIVASSNF
jgi:hypothetical protein